MFLLPEMVSKFTGSNLIGFATVHLDFRASKLRKRRAVQIRLPAPADPHTQTKSDRQRICCCTGVLGKCLLPLIEDLTNGPVPPSSNILVEFDPASQWYTASITMAAVWLRTGWGVSYNSFAQSPASIRSGLNRLGLNSPELEKNERLRIVDAYTATLGRKSDEKYAYDSLKAADLSILLAKAGLVGPPIPDRLRILDNSSTLARFNDEKSLIELRLSRSLPSASMRQLTTVGGLMKGVHSDWFYKQMEGAVDGIIDLRLEETGEEPRNLIRIRAMRNLAFDGKWHQLKVGMNFEVTLEN